MSKRLLLPAGKRGVCQWLGRPANADHFGIAPAWPYTPGQSRISLTGSVSQVDGMVDVSLLEYSVREHLNRTAQRVMGVLNPLKVVITNYPEGAEEELEAINNPEDESMGTRKVPFARSCILSRMILWKSLPENFSAWRPDAKCVCATPILSPATK